MKLEIADLANGIRQIKLSGRLDMQGTNEVDNSFAFATSSGKYSVLVDMSEVSFLASIGMRMLLSNARAQAMRGGKMVLLKPNPLIKDTLAIAGFAELIPVYDDFDDACAALEAAVSSSVENS